MEHHTQQSAFRLGRVNVLLAIEEFSSSDMDEARCHLERLEKMLKGIATPEESALWAKILVGPTEDARFDRKDAPPCGCKGKILDP